MHNRFSKFHILTQERFWSLGFWESRILSNSDIGGSGLLQGCSWVVSQISRCLKTYLGLEDLFPRWVSSSHGSWLPTEQVTQETKVETTTSFTSQSQSHICHFCKILLFTQVNPIYCERRIHEVTRHKIMERDEVGNLRPATGGRPTLLELPSKKCWMGREKVSRGKKVKQKVDFGAK